MSPGSRAKGLHQGSSLRLRHHPIRILRKCYSDPLFFPGDRLSSNSRKGGYLLQLNTLNNTSLISSPPSRTNGGYEKDAKVLITVTVEGSPGPIRTLVQQGTSVEDTIKLVIQKYGEEGRTPKLPKDAAFSFDLHVSHFNLKCLDRSNAIGETGSRSFYLRKSYDKNNLRAVAATTLATAEIMAIHGNSSSLGQPSPPRVVLPLLPFMVQKINKFMQRMQKLFKVLGCLCLDSL